MAVVPTYRLQTLFDLREREKKTAEESYAKAQRKANDEKAKLEQMQNQLKEMIAAREEKRFEYAEAMQKRVMTIDQIDVGNRHIEMLRQKEADFSQKIEDQKLTLQTAQAEADAALKKMLEATKQFKALEKHKEKWLQEVKKEQERKDEQAADEISQSQYFSRNKG